VVDGRGHGARRHCALFCVGPAVAHLGPSLAA
jgi:hypothetical protein